VMFARLTSDAREAMTLAQHEANRLMHSWVGTEHLLLGLLRQRNTRAADVLSRLRITLPSVEHALVAELGPPSRDQPLGDRDEEALRAVGIDLQEVRRSVESVFGPGALDLARPGQCGLPMMPRLKRSLERAAHEARRGPIDSGHLLLGMTEVRGALAMTLLQRLGVTPHEIRSSVEGASRAAG
jgi:ATP-dependent Clp protease ATP-binding subunit ClpA